MATSFRSVPGLTQGLSLEEWFEGEADRSSSSSELAPGRVSNPAPKLAALSFQIQGDGAPMDQAALAFKTTARTPAAKQSAKDPVDLQPGAHVGTSAPTAPAGAGASGDWVVALGFPDSGPPPSGTGASVHPGGRVRILVQWVNTASEAERTAALAPLRASRRELIHTAAMKARGRGCWR
jgi:hypothetical protein